MAQQGIHRIDQGEFAARMVEKSCRVSIEWSGTEYAGDPTEFLSLLPYEFDDIATTSHGVSANIKHAISESARRDVLRALVYICAEIPDVVVFTFEMPSHYRMSDLFVAGYQGNLFSVSWWPSESAWDALRDHPACAKTIPSLDESTGRVRRTLRQKIRSMAQFAA